MRVLEPPLLQLCIFSLVPRDLPRGMPRKRVRFSEAVQFAPPAQDFTEDEEDDENATVEEDEETASVEVEVVENTEDATEEETNPEATTEEMEGDVEANAIEVEVDKKDI